MIADQEYQALLSDVLEFGILLDSRNGPVKSLCETEQIIFTETPLVTLRKTAWQKALREMQWFLSGELTCPEELRDWWDGQLSPEGRYYSGYGEQWRNFSDDGGYDQIQALIDGLREHPHSRRLVAMTWNPKDMAVITRLNRNPQTPTTCHGTILQAFVRDGGLRLTMYQRSADLLLGAPHNWCQYWALLLWLAYHTGLRPVSLRWLGGDCHIYQHPTHLTAARAIIDARAPQRICLPTLRYCPDTGVQEHPVFTAADFVMVGAWPEPVTRIRPVLL